MEKIVLTSFVGLAFTVTICSASIYQDTNKINSTDPNYSSACLIDDKKGNVDGNYDFSCLTDQSIAAKNTVCCKEPGTDNKGCCPTSNVKGVGDPQKMIQIITILVACTVCLMIVVFVCTWCDKKTFPCLERLETRMKACWEKVEEQLPCCEKKVVKRQKVRELEEQGVPQYDIPMEYNQPIKDDFWGSGGSTSALNDTPIIMTSRP